MSDISVTLASTQVTLVNGRASLTASVTNSSPGVERVVLGVYAGPAPAAAPSGAGPVVNPVSWTTVERPLREIGPGATEQYIVSFEASSTAPAGTYGLKAIAYPADRAPEEYADRGQTMQIVVPAVAAEPPSPKKPWWILILVAILVAALGGVIFSLVRSPGTVVVPDVAGLSQAQARSALIEAGFEGTILTQTVDEPNTAADVAARTEPAAGEPADRDATITLFLGSGRVEVPNLVDRTLSSAQAELEALGLTVERTPANLSPANVLQFLAVTAQDRQGLVEIDATVTLTVELRTRTFEREDLEQFQLEPSR